VKARLEAQAQCRPPRSSPALTQATDSCAILAVPQDTLRFQYDGFEDVFRITSLPGFDSPTTAAQESGAMGDKAKPLGVGGRWRLCCLVSIIGLPGEFLFDLNFVFWNAALVIS
jgi:hypothetical protein